MADEKWISLQSHDKEGNKQKQMVKAAVIFEDIRNVPTNSNPNTLDMNLLKNILS